MESAATIGVRFAVPAAARQSLKSLEMRRVGLYPRDLVLACIVGYFECKYDKHEDFSCELLQNILGNEEHSRWYYKYFTQKNGFLQDGEARNTMKTFAEYVTWALRLNSATNSIEIVQKLSSLLHLKIAVHAAVGDLAHLKLMESLISVDGKADITFCVSNPSTDSRLFLLFPRISEDSLASLACGHHTLKSQVFSEIASKAGSYAVSTTELDDITTKCPTCDVRSPVSTIIRVKPSTDANFKRFFSECTHYRADPSRSVRCEHCATHYCRHCAVMRLMLARGPICQCGQSYETQLKEALNSPQYAWVRDLLYPNRLEISCQALNVNGSKTPSSTSSEGTVKPGMCVICSNPNAKRCGNHECCMSCVYKAYFLQDRKVCPAPNCCKAVSQKYYQTLKPCVCCKKEFQIDELFHFCMECSQAVCTQCVKICPEQYEMCRIRNEKHRVNAQKAKGILGKKRCAFL